MLAVMFISFIFCNDRFNFLLCSFMARAGGRACVGKRRGGRRAVGGGGCILATI